MYVTNSATARRANRNRRHFSKAPSLPACRIGDAQSQAPQFHASVAQCIERRASNAEVAGESPAGSTSFTSLRSPTAETLRSDRSQCGCKSCRRDHFPHLRSSAEEPPAFNRQVEGATPSGDANYLPPVAQCSKGVPLKTGELQVQRAVKRPPKTPAQRHSCTGEANSCLEDQWNANRTSEPGPGANGIVPPASGMGCKSSAFRHYQRDRASEGRNLSR